MLLTKKTGDKSFPGFFLDVRVLLWILRNSFKYVIKRISPKIVHHLNVRPGWNSMIAD